MAPHSSMSKTVNACSTPLYVQRSPNLVRLYRKKKKPVFTSQFKKIISLDQLSRSSQSFQQSEQSRGDAEGREMSTIQTSALPQETGCDGPRQDGQPLSYLQVHPRLLSSKRTVREILAELRRMSQTQMCENDEDRVTAEQRKIQFLLPGCRQRVIPAAPEEKHLRTRSHHVDQKTNCDDHRKESNQDEFPRPGLQVYPRLRASRKTRRKMTDLRMMRPRLQRQICENVQDRVTTGQRKIQPLVLTSSRKRVRHEENQVPSKRCHQVAQKNDNDHHQEFVEDVFPRLDLRAHPRRSSPEADLEIGTESNLAQPQRLICENGENRVTVGQRKILHPFPQRGRMPEVLKENRVPTERSQQSDQKDCRRYYLSVPTVREVLGNGRLIRQPGMNVPRVMIRPHPTTQRNCQRSSQMVSPIKSRVIGNISSVHPQNQRNRMDFIEREVVPRGNLGKPESCCQISAADGKLKNEASRPISNDSRPSGHGITSVISPKMQQYMERYLDRWATEPTFLEEVRSIASTLSQKGLFSIGTSSEGEPQSNSASLPPPEYSPWYSPMSP